MEKFGKWLNWENSSRRARNMVKYSKFNDALLFLNSLSKSSNNFLGTSKALFLKLNFDDFDFIPLL